VDTRQRRPRHRALLAGFEELLGPAIVEVLGDALLAAQLGDAVLPTQPFEQRILSSAEKRRRGALSKTTAPDFSPSNALSFASASRTGFWTLPTGHQPAYTYTTISRPASCAESELRLQRVFPRVEHWRACLGIVIRIPRDDSEPVLKGCRCDEQ